MKHTLSTSFPGKLLPAIFLLVVAFFWPRYDLEAAPSGPISHRDVHIKYVPWVPLGVYQHFDGDIWDREALTGDWSGTRYDLVDKGFKFFLDNTSTYTSVIDGGNDEGGAFYNNVNFYLEVDFDRLGWASGGTLTTRVEARSGNSILPKAGTVNPISYNSAIPPFPNGFSDVGVTDFYYTKFFNPKVGMLFGRMDSHTPGSLREFNGMGPHAGDKGFSNMSIMATPQLAVSLPYVTPLGAGVLYNPGEKLNFTSVFMARNDATDSLGFDELGDDGITSIHVMAFQYGSDELPGGGSIFGAYAWGGDYTKLTNESYDNFLVTGEPLKSSTNWTFSVNWWQYLTLFGDEKATGELINIRDNVPDYRGLGVFITINTGDPDTQTNHWTFVTGLSGRGLFDSRPDDYFGLAGFYSTLSDGRYAELVEGLNGNESGVELFYTIAITGWAEFTIDAQYIGTGKSTSDNATVLGARLNIVF